MSDLGDLPLDICHEILFRLPAESLFRLRSVSKRWLTTIDDPSFARAHQLSSSSHTLLIQNYTWREHHLHTFDLDALNLFTNYQQISGSSLDLKSSLIHLPLPVPSYNGLILVRALPGYEIWNPSTHERLQLPGQVRFFRPGSLFIGLGYDHAAQDMKAVAMDSQQTHVYSLRQDTWATIGACQFKINDTSPRGQEYHGVFLCGAVHWLLLDSKALPKSVGLKHVGVLGGCLVVSYFNDDAQSFDVWVMKDYGSESWTKSFSINNRAGLTGVCFAYLRPVANMKDKNLVFMRDGKSGLFLFNVRRGCLERFCIHGLNGNLHAQITPQTIFRLRDYCGGSSVTSRIQPLCPPTQMIKATLTTQSFLD